CFSCASDSGREDTRPLSSDSYNIGCSRSKLLLSSKGCCCIWPQPHADYEEDTVDIFGFPWVPENSLVESTKLLFGLFRDGQSSSLHYEAEDLRQQRVLFLQYVKDLFLFKRSKDQHSVRLKDLPANIQRALLGQSR
uniref:Protein MMS22-like N-terminal domain-containing protein n=1 Tax=Oncorhynchus kisutch TaxID=8019 RepID=A0A8C7DJV4_ONCKI